MNTAKERIRALREQINQYNYQYFVKAEPIVTDYEYDIKLKELEKLEKEYPEYDSPNSPTKKVGSDQSGQFKAEPHSSPMLSLGNTYNEAELKEFENRIKKNIPIPTITYSCELKIDGLAIAIYYTDGKLTKALTRGNGIEGENVTENVKTIHSIPLQLIGSYPKQLEVRGEIFMHKNAFHKLNLERNKHNLPPFANPRNVAAGSLKLLDSREVAKRPLDLYIYSVQTNQENTQHDTLLQKAQTWGLPISPYSKRCEGIEQVMEYIKQWDSKRQQLSFEIDGVVIKVNSYAYQKQLGFTAKSPRWAISYKYKTHAALTQLLSVDYQVGRTGAITPVANLEPVNLLGTRVKRASLHNANEIQRLDLHYQDYVYVEKGGEIIPKITGIELTKRQPSAEPIKMITHCPECKSPLIRYADEANHYCENENHCAPQVIGKIQHYISRKAMNIENLGKETVEMLYRKKIIQQIPDLYNLKYHHLISLERMGSKSIQNLLNGIQQSQKIPFSKVLFALGIRHVGETVAKKLAHHFGSIQNLMKAGKEELNAVPEIGEKIATSIQNYFSKEENKQIIHTLQQQGIQFQIQPKNQTEKQISQKLKDKNLVISGTFEQYSREEIKQHIEQAGGNISSSVSSKTHYFVMGKKVGPAKLQKVQQEQIPILTESELITLLELPTNTNPNKQTLF